MIIDVQNWSTPDGAEEPQHVHLGGDLPLYRQVSGAQAITYRYQLHEADGTITKLNQDGNGLRDPSTKPWPPIVSSDGEFVVLDKGYTINSAFQQDGWRVFKPAAHFFDRNLGLHRFVRLEAEWDCRNGNGTPNLKRLDGMSGQAWVEEDPQVRGYSNVTLATGSIPLAPVSGLWKPLIRFGSSIQGQLRHGFVSIDPSFHADPPYPGIVVFDKRNLEKRFLPVPIDTTQLPNGPHKLFMKASDEGMFPGFTLEGVLVVAFEVRN